jgi:integrase/recombinase XerD
MIPLPAKDFELSRDDARLIELWIATKASRHTRRAYAFEANRFLRFHAQPLAQVTLADLMAWIGHLSPSATSASINRALTAVKSLLSFAQQIGYLNFNAGAAVKLRPSRDRLASRILDEPEIAHLIAAATEGRNRVLLKLLYASGVRVAELCALRWSDVLERREGDGQITVFGKGSRTRTILLQAGIWNQLQSLRNGAENFDPVFRSSRGGALDVSQVRRIVYAAARKAGLEQNVSPHWMRHAHASHALDRGAPIHLVQTTLGHASIATTGRYLHARPTESSGFYLPKDL